MFECVNKNTIIELSEKVQFGSNVVFGSNCNKITFGFGCYIGNDVYIDVPELIVGDYTTIHRGITIHGYKQCKIGHNCWIGQFSIIDSIGGTNIGNNVGIGGHSQLWSHIKFGDTLEGCRWNSEKELIVEDDVWFVGHCIVSPIHAKKRSMLMVGGVATINMEENHIYAGVPAKDVTRRLGTQFIDISLDNKIKTFKKLYRDFLKINNLTEIDYKIKILKSSRNMPDSRILSTFNLKERTYIPTRSENEYKFMKYLLYEKAKFVPYYITK